jgi:hypothetical protein
MGLRLGLSKCKSCVNYRTISSSSITIVIPFQKSIFILSSCVAVALANLDREPDAAWRIRPARIPGYNAILHAGIFPLDPMTGLEAPSLVVDMACSNESNMPKLTPEDLGNYFGPGTGTRLLICVKVFKKAASQMPHRWWFGMAQSDQFTKLRYHDGEFAPHPSRYPL